MRWPGDISESKEYWPFLVLGSQTAGKASESQQGVNWLVFRPVMAIEDTCHQIG